MLRIKFCCFLFVFCWKVLPWDHVYKMARPITRDTQRTAYCDVGIICAHNTATRDGVTSAHMVIHCFVCYLCRKWRIIVWHNLYRWLLLLTVIWNVIPRFGMQIFVRQDSIFFELFNYRTLRGLQSCGPAGSLGLGGTHDYALVCSMWDQVKRSTSVLKPRDLNLIWKLFLETIFVIHTETPWIKSCIIITNTKFFMWNTFCPRTHSDRLCNNIDLWGCQVFRNFCNLFLNFCNLFINLHQILCYKNVPEILVVYWNLSSISHDLFMHHIVHEPDPQILAIGTILGE